MSADENDFRSTSKTGEKKEGRSGDRKNGIDSDSEKETSSEKSARKSKKQKTEEVEGDDEKKVKQENKTDGTKVGKGLKKSKAKDIVTGTAEKKENTKPEKKKRKMSAAKTQGMEKANEATAIPGQLSKEANFSAAYHEIVKNLIATSPQESPIPPTLPISSGSPLSLSSSPLLFQQLSTLIHSITSSVPPSSSSNGIPFPNLSGVPVLPPSSAFSASSIVAQTPASKAKKSKAAKPHASTNAKKVVPARIGKGESKSKD